MENNIDINNIDKLLVTESCLTFNRGSDSNTLVLTDDGIVEQYYNNNLSQTMPFSKLAVVRESKTLLASGYKLSEATILQQHGEDEISLENPEETKQELQKEIQDVEEIQDLKDELEDKLTNLNEDDTVAEDYVLVIYTKIGDDYEPDVCIKGFDNGNWVVADSIEDAKIFNKEEAEKIAEQSNEENKNADRYICKAVKFDDLGSLNGLYESKEIKTEDTSDLVFPSTDYTKQVLSAGELKYLNLDKVLTIEQIAWIQSNIGNIYEVEDGLCHFVNQLGAFGDDPVISIDEYINQLNSRLKGEL